jgi:hypothetical protein
VLQLVGILPPAPGSDCDTKANDAIGAESYGEPEKTAKIEIADVKKPADFHRRACWNTGEA